MKQIALKIFCGMNRQEETFEFRQPFALQEFLKYLLHFRWFNLSQMSQNSTDLLLAISLYDIMFS